MTRRLMAGMVMVVLATAMLPGVASAKDKDKDKDACKKDGWETLQGADGGFASKQDCKDYVDAGGELLPACTPNWAEIVGPYEPFEGMGNGIPTGMVACAATGYRAVLAVEPGGVFIGDDRLNSVQDHMRGTFYGMGGNDQAGYDCESDNCVTGTVYGGDGNDWVHAVGSVWAGEPAGTFYGGNGDDELYNLRSGTFYGGPGNDSISQDWCCTFYGEDGDDTAWTLLGGEFHGGPGTDRVSDLYGGWTDAEVIDQVR